MPSGGSTSAATTSPASKWRPTTVTRVGAAELGGAVPTHQPGRVPDPVQGGTGIVAHAAVDGDVRVRAGALDGEHVVERDARRARYRPPGFDDEAGHREPRCRARLGQLRTQLAGQQGQVQGRFTGPVGDAVTAAQVEFGQDQTVLFVQPGHEADKAPYGGPGPHPPPNSPREHRTDPARTMTLGIHRQQAARSSPVQPNKAHTRPRARLLMCSQRLPGQS